MIVGVVATGATTGAAAGAAAAVLFHRRRRRQTFIGDDEGDGVGCRARDGTVSFS